jgi:hypothetical protein
VKTLLNKTLLNKTLLTTDLLSNKLFTGWLPVIRQIPGHKVALAAAGLAVTAGAVAGSALGAGSDPHPASAATRPAWASTHVAPAQEPAAQEALAARTKKAAAKNAAAKQEAAKQEAAKQEAAKQEAAKQEAAMPRDKEVSVDYQSQTTFYFCGPAATRIAASAQGHDLSQDDAAAKLGTTVNGTPSAVDTTRVLNDILGSDTYHTTSIPGPPTQAQTDKVKADVMRSLNNGRAVVANIAGTTTDVTGAAHKFDGGHYVAVVGYHDQGDTVEISDPADVNGADSYWISTGNLAQWMATHGYSS